MAAVHYHGFRRLPGGDTSADQLSLNIIFVHGLRGHPRGTWDAAPVATSERLSNATKKHRSVKSWFQRRGAASPPASTEQAHASSSSSSSVFWPEQYLTSDIPQARVWTFGYNADVIGGLFQANNKNSISQHGRDLPVRLERDIDNSRPIAFVVHSLGGIIVKDAIRRSEKIRERTKLIMFLGTPHRGNSNKKMLEALEVNSEVLDNIHEEFKMIVVDDFSSKLDLPRTLETVGSIDANHMQMARYSSKDDQGYRAVCGVLRSFIQEEPESQKIAPASAPDVSTPGALFMVPFARDDLFVGREDIITEISEKRAVSRNHTRLALVELGGIGKSQFAIEYAYRIQQAEPRTLVVWIHASNRTRLEQRYGDIADSILVPGREDPKVDVLQLVCTWLSDGRHGRWLMILDNIDDDAVFFGGDEDTAGTAQMGEITSYKRPLEGFLPQTPNGTILITSRNNLAAANLVGTYGSIVQVEPMEEEDALALLNTRVPFDESDKADAKALVQALERIPLAITQAAAYIKTRAQTTTMSGYLELFHASEENQVRLLGRKGLQDLRRDHSVRHAVIATWQISFTQIQKTEQPAVDLLALMSMFDKQGIPMSLLRKSTRQLDFDDSLEPLLSVSLVRAEIGKQSFGMHRLVQLSMRTWLGAEKQLSRWVKESIRVLSAAFPSGDYETWPDCQVLLQHARETMSHVADDKEDMLNQAEIRLKIGWYLLLRGEFKAAEKVGRTCVEAREKALGPEHIGTLTSVSQLGSVLERQGKYEEAEAMHRRALKGYEKALGAEHPDTLTSMANLASTFWSQRQWHEAEDLDVRVMETRKRVLGDEHPDTLTAMNNLAFTLKSQSRNDEALLFEATRIRSIQNVNLPQLHSHGWLKHVSKFFYGCLMNLIEDMIVFRKDHAFDVAHDLATSAVP
ncbi:hypothetical protein K458DRAFT_430168 [Lentithecium fluviatile CBS 122367]|uniref:DUF7779 domain-containing protein n=1 Tax=Lentithecium fluviatile CBS 122367 TaxID=1168545 RepID=A0A6G1J722_9PLEO|nr:hypothetical protein K458DRAFT_430168 [Lentithecium fluviatile CBS 122367]